MTAPATASERPLLGTTWQVPAVQTVTDLAWEKPQLGSLGLLAVMWETAQAKARPAPLLLVQSPSQHAVRRPGPAAAAPRSSIKLAPVRVQPPWLPPVRVSMAGPQPTAGGSRAPWRLRRSGQWTWRSSWALRQRRPHLCARGSRAALRDAASPAVCHTLVSAERLLSGTDVLGTPCCLMHEIS